MGRFDPNSNQGAAPNITLSSSANPSIFGRGLTINAILHPERTGTVTFYDGVARIAAKTLTGGQAAMVTVC